MKDPPLMLIATLFHLATALYLALALLAFVGAARYRKDPYQRVLFWGWLCLGLLMLLGAVVVTTLLRGP